MLAAPAALALIPTAADARNDGSAPVTGRTVTIVRARESRFALGPMRRWTETSASGATFEFDERARDERSVYLSDSSRGVRLQLDVARALVLYADEDEPQMRPLYPITSSAADVNGWNVIYARVPSGRYLMTGPRVWVERGNDGVEFTFAEGGRDERSVSLEDASRGVRLQLDLERELVLYGNFDTFEMQPLYTITGTAAITT
jgi:hypothetical protein